MTAAPSPTDNRAPDRALPVICLVSELSPPPGGMAVQAEMLTAGLRRQGHQVINVPTNALAHGSAWRRIALLRGMVNLSVFLSRLWPSCFKADVVHIFSHSYLSFFLFTLPAVAAGKMMGKRVIIHYHGGAAEAFLERWFWLARLALESADVLIVPSGFLTRIFGRYHLRTTEVPNILPLDTLPFRERSPLRPRILVARHLEANYNVACALRAFSILHRSFPDATLTIGGDGSEKPALTSLLQKLGIARSVTFTGNVDSIRMRSLFDSNDIYLNSSHIDNQPVSLLEAFACGLPAVTTAVGGIPDMATHGEDALLAPDNDDAGLAGHMIALLKDTALCARIVRHARQRALGHSWGSIYGKLRQIYLGELLA